MLWFWPDSCGVNAKHKYPLAGGTAKTVFNFKVQI